MLNIEILWSFQLSDWQEKFISFEFEKDYLLCISEWRWKALSPVWLLATPWTMQSIEFPGQNTGVGSLSLLQGIFPIQGSNPGLLHYRQILYQLSHQESPRILECVAYSFSSRSSRTRNWTRVSCIAGGFFTSWATREAHQLGWYTMFWLVDGDQYLGARKSGGYILMMIK